MKLLRLEIQNFGKFSGYTQDLTDGLNTLCEENGWGKSTLAVFIKAMLYGLPATRKTDLDLNERRKYAPWGGGTFGGSLSFESAKGRFRIERVFGLKEAQDEFRLYELDTNKPSDAYGPDVGTALFGIDADGFERSAYLSERALDAKSENASVLSKLTGLIEDPDDIGCYDDAQALIDKRRRYYEVKGGRGYLSELETEYNEKKQRLADLREKAVTEAETAAALREAEKKTVAAEKALNDCLAVKNTAEKNRLLRSQYGSLQAAVRSKERREAEISGAFGGTVPTDAEVSANRARLSEYRSTQRTLADAALSDEEQKRLADLSGRFPKDIPSAADFDRADTAERARRDAESALRGMTEPEVSPAVLRVLHVGIPSAETLNRAGRVIDDADRLAAEERAPHITERRTRRIPLFLPLLALLFGIGLFALLAVPTLSLQPLPLGLGGGALVLTALILFLAGGAPKKSAHTEPKKPTSVEVLAPIVSMLEGYGLHRAGGNCRDELAQLSMLCGQARSYEGILRQLAPKRRELNDRIAGSTAELNAFFVKYALTVPAKENTARTLARLRSDADTLEALRRRDAAMREKRVGLEEKRDAEKAAIAAFFSRLTAARAGNAPEDCQAQMERLCLEYRQLQKDLAEARQSVSDFYGTHRAILDAPEQPAADTAGTESRLRAALENARKEENALRVSLNRLSDATAEIPELTDRIAYLGEESATARANFATLRKTAKYLEAAKEALSTRYLGGMQAAFERRLALLGKSTSLQAVIDPQLSLTVRDGGISRSLATASRGTRDLLQFCARLALTEVLSADGEKPFLLLDDPFVNFDAPHLEAALAYLRALGKDTQILYLVCHESRAAKGTRA